MVGNKSDEELRRQVTTEQGSKVSVCLCVCVQLPHTMSSKAPGIAQQFKGFLYSLVHINELCKCSLQ